MAVRALDHVNIRTEDVPGTVAFFKDVLGLRAAAAPGAESIDKGCWIHDPNDRPIIHIGPVNAHYPSDEAFPFSPARGSAAVHHVALECDDLPGMMTRLEAAGANVVRKDYPPANLCQLFVEERNGIILELNFRQEQA
jgi:catechol 2,3-dioxygenase-like lactoylglutathione lyase family enzyme